MFNLSYIRVSWLFWLHFWRVSSNSFFVSKLKSQRKIYLFDCSASTHSSSSEAGTFPGAPAFPNSLSLGCLAAFHSVKNYLSDFFLKLLPTSSKNINLFEPLPSVLALHPGPLLPKPWLKISPRLLEVEGPMQADDDFSPSGTTKKGNILDGQIYCVAYIRRFTALDKNGNFNKLRKLKNK